MLKPSSSLPSDNYLDQAAFSTMGGYRIGELLGEGAMGRVYLAEHELLRRPAAILDGESLEDRLRREHKLQVHDAVRFALHVGRDRSWIDAYGWTLVPNTTMSGAADAMARGGRHEPIGGCR